MRKKNLIVGIIGKDGRTSAIEECLSKSPRLSAPPLRATDWKNEPSPNHAIASVLRCAKENHIDFFVNGPEEPLAAGVVDKLEEIGIPCIGPTQALASLESSKAFTRNLLTKYDIPGNPEFRVFKDLQGVEGYLKNLGEYVIKPDGLTGGKGVKISNAHLFSIPEALQYCREVLSHHPAMIIEEKLDGEEFSLQSFSDGVNVAHMPVVQDHKRAGEGDTGPNTGGMGSYSCSDHSLPFLEPKHLKEAQAINEAVAHALFSETGKKYKGILYGGFMITANGIRLLEYNARFGDPETLNVLSLLKTDFVDICEAIIEGTLDKLRISFDKRATVCKYVVPENYPDNPVRGAEVGNIPKPTERLRIYRAAVDEVGGKLFLTGSRAIAFVGISENLADAQSIAEEAASSVSGPVFHRRDIGTAELISQRVAHVKSLLNSKRRAKYISA